MNYLLGYDERSADTFIDRGAEAGTASAELRDFYCGMNTR